MKRKISLSTTVTLVLLTMALTISLTMLLAMRHFNNQLQTVGVRQQMYSYVHDVDQKVRACYPQLDEAELRKGIAQGYIAALNKQDPYAAYYEPTRYAAEQLRLSGKATNMGITLTLTADKKVVVSRVQPNSNAAAQGVKQGDVVGKAVVKDDFGNTKEVALVAAADASTSVLQYALVAVPVIVVAAIVVLVLKKRKQGAKA